MRYNGSMVMYVLIGIALCAGCKALAVNGIADRLVPSGDRRWQPDQSIDPFVLVDGPEYTIRNIRNCNYLTKDDFVVNYYHRKVNLRDVRSVDFIVVPFKQAPKLAHTMISFGFADGTYLAVSVEVRKEEGEAYNPLAGFVRQYELIYILGDERDLIGLRTQHRGDNVYLYRSVAQPAQAQMLFASVMNRVNKLTVEPEFYNSLVNNCTTNLANHVNEVSPNRVRFGWKVLLPGFSAEYAHELGLLDQSIPFEQLTAAALIDSSVEPTTDYSTKIRQ